MILTYFKKRVPLITITLVAIMLALHTQAVDVKGMVAKHMDAIRLKKQSTMNFKLITADNEMVFLDEVSAYLKDQSAPVRYEVYALAQAAGKRSSSNKTKIKSTDIVSIGLLDTIGQNTKFCSRSLTSFPKSVFSKLSAQNVQNAFGNKYADMATLVKLVAFLEVKDAKVELLKQKALFAGNVKMLWNYNQALARLGDKTSAQELLASFKAQRVNDDVLEILGPGMIFSHDKSCVKALIDILNDDAANCVSPNPDSDARIACGYRVMEMLAPYINDFPLKLHVSGDIDTKDYPSALKTAREWFKKKGDAYDFNNELY